jgi:hypothetical protein
MGGASPALGMLSLLVGLGGKETVRVVLLIDAECSWGMYVGVKDVYDGLQ